MDVFLATLLPAIPMLIILFVIGQKINSKKDKL